jgi:hypothetical protein
MLCDFPSRAADADPRARREFTGGSQCGKGERGLYRFLSSCGKQWSMGTDRENRRRIVPLLIGLSTLASVVLLLAQDAAPRIFPALTHEVLAAFSLATIALAYLIFQFMRRDAPAGWGPIVKAVLLAAAFLFWAANQFWPHLPQAGLLNDIAIALFVLDVFLAIAGRPAQSGGGVFAESCGCSGKRCEACGCHDGGGRAA